jgi:hypothetical protein
MCGGKCSAVIGQETRFFICAQQYEYAGYGSFLPITALYSPLYIKPRIFAKRQCKLQQLTLSPEEINSQSLLKRVGNNKENPLDFLFYDLRA